MRDFTKRFILSTLIVTFTLPLAIVTAQSHPNIYSYKTDSDRDGIPDIAEVLLGSNPGDPNEKDNNINKEKFLHGIIDINQNGILDCYERINGEEPYLSFNPIFKPSVLSSAITDASYLGEIDIQSCPVIPQQFQEHLCRTRTQRNCFYSCAKLNDTTSFRCRNTNGMVNSSAVLNNPKNIPKILGNFKNGKTTGFGIPKGLTGTITTGKNVWTTVGRCAVCHKVEKLNRNYPHLVDSLRSPPMSLIKLTKQQFADLTAYLNRNSK